MLFVLTQIANGQGSDTIWIKSYPVGAIVDVKKTNDCGYIIAGSNHVLKLDLNGNTLWTYNYESISITAICVTKNNEYVAAGQSSDGIGLVS